MKMFNFLLNNKRDIALCVLVVIVFYWFNSMFNFSKETVDNYQSKLDSIDNKILYLKEQQMKIDENISEFNNQISDVERTISKVKNEKTIIKEVYEKKINSIDKYTDAQLDSFFAERYGGQYTK